MITRAMAFALTAVVACGCTAAMTEDGQLRSQAPIAVNFPISDQRYARGVDHWRVIARETAREISAHFVATYRPPLPALAVPKPTRGSEFDSLYHDILVAELVRGGFRVSEVSTRCAIIGPCPFTAPGPIPHFVVTTSVKLVTHDPDRFVRMPPGTLTATTVGGGALALASWGIVGAGSPIGAAALAALGIAATADITSGAEFHTPNTEVLVTTLVKTVTGTAEVATQGAYYVPPTEAGQFSGHVVEITDQ